jgi:hypothetical protein
VSKKTREQLAKDQVERDLDEALEETFPASDPPQMTHPPTEDQTPLPRSQRRSTERRGARGHADRNPN